MRLRAQGLVTALVLGCACGATSPAVVGGPSRKESVTLQARGYVNFTLEDVTGRVDSLNNAGKQVARIAGCEREYFEQEAGLEPYTMFTFGRAPYWPLELRWRGEPSDTVTVIVRCTVDDSTCVAGATVVSAGTRVDRLKIERKLGQRGCALKIVGTARH